MISWQALQTAQRESKIAQLQCLAQRLRLQVFDVLHDRGTGHWGGAASAAELLTTLYFHIMSVSPEEPQWPQRDRLILSKGHASCMLYSVLSARGFFAADELRTFRRLDSRLQGHPCMRKTPGVDMSTGALGHGLSVGLGMALAGKQLAQSYWTFVLTGEGCLNEGQTWEAIMAAAKFAPSKLVLMIDYNKVQLDGPSDEVMPLDPLREKLIAFNWRVLPRVFDGHCVADIVASWEEILRHETGPIAVVYRTTKGKGVSFMEDSAKWHSGEIDQQSHAQGRVELLETLRVLEARL